MNHKAKQFNLRDLIQIIYWSLHNFLLAIFKPFKYNFSSTQFHQYELKVLTKNEIPQILALLDQASLQDLLFFKPFPFNSFFINFYFKLCSPFAFSSYGLFEHNQLVSFIFYRRQFQNFAYLGYFVHPQFRGRKLSQFMMKSLVNHLSNNNIKALTTVNPQNGASINTSSCYDKIGERKNGDWILLHHPLK